MTGRVDRTDTHTIYYNSNGKYHREDGPAVEYADGRTLWYINNRLHREDGPAYILPNGTKSWFIHGKLHREDGPAIEWSNGFKFWYVNGHCITEKANQWRKEMGITNEYLTKEESALFVLYFGNIK